MSCDDMQGNGLCHDGALKERTSYNDTAKVKNTNMKHVIAKTVNVIRYEVNVTCTTRVKYPITTQECIYLCQLLTERRCSEGRDRDKTVSRKEEHRGGLQVLLAFQMQADSQKHPE